MQAATTAPEQVQANAGNNTNACTQAAFNRVVNELLGGAEGQSLLPCSSASQLADKICAFTPPIKLEAVNALLDQANYQGSSTRSREMQIMRLIEVYAASPT